MRVAKRDYFANFISTNKQNMKAIWSTINQLVGESTRLKSKLKDISSNVINDYFVSLGPNAVKNVSPITSYTDYLKNPCVNSISLTPVTSNEIEHYSNNLESEHSCSFDELSTFVLNKIISKIFFINIDSQ